MPAKTAKNWADLIDRIGATCQLLARIRSARLEKFGVVATKFIPKRCLTSIPMQLPRNARDCLGRTRRPQLGCPHRHR